jgi:hypothetical protein
MSYSGDHHRCGGQDYGIMRFGAHDYGIMRFRAKDYHEDYGIMKVP